MILQINSTFVLALFPTLHRCTAMQSMKLRPDESHTQDQNESRQKQFFFVRRDLKTNEKGGYFVTFELSP